MGPSPKWWLCQMAVARSNDRWSDHTLQGFEIGWPRQSVIDRIDEPSALFGEEGLEKLRSPDFGACLVPIVDP